MTKNRVWLLVVLALGLGALLWWDNQRGGAPDRPRIIPRAGETAPRAATTGTVTASLASSAPITGADREAANPLASLDRASLEAMTERPLFAPSRRRPPPPSLTTSAPEPPAPPLPPKPMPPSYVLLGVVKDGERAIALLRNRSNGRHLRVEAGDIIAGWQIAAVGPLSVTLKGSDGAVHEVQLLK